MKIFFVALLAIVISAITHSEASAQYGGGYHRPRAPRYCPPPPPPPAYYARPAYCAPPRVMVRYGRRYYAPRPRYYAGYARPYRHNHGYRRCR